MAGASFDVMALSLRITSEGFQQAFRDLERLDVRGRQTTQSLNQLAAAAARPTEQMSRGGIILLNTMGRTDQAVRKTTEATVTFGQRVAQGAHVAGRFGGALEGLARSGTMSGGALRGVLNVGSSIAAMFGPTGMIIGALSFFGLTAVRIFQRSREEAESLTRSLDAMVRSLRAPGTTTAQVAQAMVTLHTGDPTLEDTPENRARRLGAAGLMREQQRLRQEIADLERDLAGRTAASTAALGAAAGATVDEERVKRLRADLLEIETAIANVTKTRADLTQRLVDVSTVEVDIARTRERVEKENEARAIEREHRRLSGLAAANMRAGLGLITAGATRDVGGAGIERIVGGDASARRLLDFAPRVREIVMTATQSAEEALLTARDRLAGAITEQFGEGLRNALESAFTRAFETGNLLEGIQELGRGVLRALGQMFVDIGRQLISFGQILENLKRWIFDLFGMGGPAAIIAGLGLIALGSALGAAGAGGGGGGRGGGGGFGFAQPTVPDISRRTLPSLSAVQPGNVTPGMIQIGPNFGWNPELDRQVKESVNRATRRRI